MRILRYLLPAISLTVLPVIAQGQVVINEYSAANFDFVYDNYNDREDWIEIYNAGTAPVDISGYWLSDKDDDPMRWAFPVGTTIDAGEHILIWASGRDEAGGGNYHTSFKLSQTKQEYVVLSDPSGNILDMQWIETPNQQNHSFGRLTDGGEDWGVFTTPTPGSANVGGYSGYTVVSIDTEPGYYSGSVSVVMSTDDFHNTIHYTTDGSTPTAASPVYSTPVNLTTTTVIRARAISTLPDVTPGFVQTSTFFVNTTHTVDILSISGDELETLLNGTQIEPIGHIELFTAEGVRVAQCLGEYNKHGNDSWAYPQRGLDYISRDQLGFGNALEHQIFKNKDRDEFKRIIIKGGANDNYPFEDGGAHIRDAYVQSLSQIADLRMDERTYHPCVMYVNGKYWGVYEIREKVDDIDFTDHYYDQGDGEVNFLKTWGGTWVEYGTNTGWIALRDFILSNDMTDPANYEYVKERYNVGSLIDYFLMNSYVVCSDWLNWNTAWWHGTNPAGDKKKWRYVLWDMDAVFGHYTNYTGIPDQSFNADPCFAEMLNNPGGQGHVPIWNALLQNEEFFSDYINRYADLASTYFSCEFMQAHLDSLIQIIEPEMPAQIERWGGTMAEWQSNVQDIRDFIDDRCAIMNAGILDCYPELDGPHNIVLYANPPEGGRIDLPSLEVDTYPHTVEYFGGVNVEFDADENEGYVFSHWTSSNHTIAPDGTSEEIVMNFSSNDTLIAHFIADVSYVVTLNAVPENGGTITVGGVLYDDFPATIELAESALHNAVVAANPGFEFQYWFSDFELNEGSTATSVNFTVGADGSLTAHFSEIVHDVTFNVMPEGVGVIRLDGETLTDLPVERAIPQVPTVSLETEAVMPFYEFSHWTFLNNNPDPDENSPSVEVDFTGSDMVIANYRYLPNFTLKLNVVPEGAGWIRMSDTLVKSFPFEKNLLGGESYMLVAEERNPYEFSHWEVVYGMPITYKDRPRQNYPLHSATSLVAHFKERLNAVWVPNAFTPNMDGHNDILKVYGIEVEDENFRFEIMDRWGGTLFGTSDINQGWNGTKQGSNYLVPPGSYAYFLRYRNAITGRVVEEVGSVVVIR